jgi:hypothetical protein
MLRTPKSSAAPKIKRHREFFRSPFLQGYNRREDCLISDLSGNVPDQLFGALDDQAWNKVRVQARRLRP